MVADVLELGEILLEARSLIGRGHWLKWLDDLGLSEDMARRFMDVSEMNKSRNLRDWGQQIPLSDQLERLALHQLLRPASEWVGMPRAIVEYGVRPHDKPKPAEIEAQTTDAGCAEAVE